MKTEIPFGNYCYGYWIVEGGEQRPVSERPAELAATLDLGLPDPRFCPHWQEIEGGRVRCALKGSTAPILGKEETWKRYYDQHTEARESETSDQWMLGDSVKVCSENREQPDFHFLPEGMPQNGDDSLPA